MKDKDKKPYQNTIRVIFAASVINMVVNIIFAYTNFSNGENFFAALHLIIILSSAATLIGLLFNKASFLFRIVVLVSITTVVTVFYDLYPDRLQQAASIFGVSAFIWLFIDRFMED